ncbi:MAG: hypothetical protein B7733_10770 [Myxococcales bacterium FL481]|nr:MAG: hypothetical protein B7733_10770 [Myxococcales bacterium FL481]
MQVASRLSARLLRLMWATRKLRLDLEVAIACADAQSRAHALLRETLDHPHLDIASRQRRDAARYEQSLREVGRGLTRLRNRAWQLDPADRLELETLGTSWGDLEVLTSDAVDPPDATAIVAILRELELSLASRSNATYR